MQIKPYTTLFALLLTAAPTYVAAEEEPTFKTDLEFGWIATSGNTETTSAKAVANIKHNTKNWRHNYIFDAYRSKNQVTIVDADTALVSEESQTTANQYGASVKNTFKLDSKNAGLFFLTTYEDDEFSGFDYQGSVSAGYGNRFFETPKSSFDYSVGPGYSFNKEITTEETNENFIVRVDLDYAYAFSETAKFTQTISSDIAGDSDENTKTKAVSALTANINNALALKVAITLDYNSEVPDPAAGELDIKHADVQSSVTLVYSF